MKIVTEKEINKLVYDFHFVHPSQLFRFCLKVFRLMAKEINELEERVKELEREKETD